MSSKMKAPIGQRLQGVDILRGLAIFFVLMNHINMRLRFAKIPYTEGLPDQLVTSLVWNGQRGVQIFFAVSGFLITATSLRRWSPLSRISLRGFYLMRFARIAPLLLLLLGVLSALHLAQAEHFVVSAKTGGLPRALLAALTLHVNVLEARRGYLPGNWDILWSLSVEEMFYLFFPVVARIFGRGKLFIGLLLGFVVLGPFARTVFTHGNETWKEYSYLGGMDAIALGCLTALVAARFRFSRGVLWTVCAIGVALLVFSLCFSVQADAWGLDLTGLDMTVVAVGTCLVIAGVAQLNWKGPRILRPLLGLGERSYEIYLTHMFVVFGVFALFVRAGKPMWGVPALFIVVIAAAGLLGEVVARFYSEPLNQWIRERWGRTKTESGPST
ncbi:MAG TPA: acyltransferase [Candidatus Acidoferrum sp.]|nr:acyltransferase [Candidatus Acidoferrum sp.]